MYKKIFLLSVLFAALIIAGCKNEKNNTRQNGTSFRKGDLFSEDFSLGEKAVVTANAPGKNEREERAFENAPPLIPHKVEGFFPITQKNNICLSCHMPDKAEAVGSTPLPASHFTNYRPEIVKSGNRYQESNKSLTVAKDLNGKLSPARYNCEQCHVPQTNARLDVRNLFEAEFRNDKSKSKSDLDQRINEGVK
ncbi:MAG: nitrate reductase cytochrome c-type subunit [Bacteroidales bacterium]|nr:nitrate reductase cytochrome c-type subunit [Bacteroidales bacterium]